MTTSSSFGHRQRLKNRFLAGEASAQTEEALLELLLAYAIPQRDVQPLTRKLLARFGTLNAVLAADADALCEVSGLKAHAATLIKLVEQIRALPSPNGKAVHPLAMQESQQTSLFEVSSAPPPALEAVPAVEAPPSPARAYTLLPKRGGELFSQSVLDEAIRLLPQLPETESLDEVAEFLTRRMRFNSEQTRRRYVSYVTRRMFPAGRADVALRRFARAFAGRQELRDVCYYRFCKAESLMFRVTDDVLLPAIGRGTVERPQVREYLAQRFPEAGNIADCAKAIARVLADANIAKATRTHLTFAYREPLLPALAFVIHSEFAPGMYDLGQSENNPALRALLWNPDHLLPALYELRNRSWIAKISEIDNVRQFTLRWTLDELVTALTAKGEGREGH